MPDVQFPDSDWEIFRKYNFIYLLFPLGFPLTWFVSLNTLTFAEPEFPIWDFKPVREKSISPFENLVEYFINFQNILIKLSFLTVTISRNHKRKPQLGHTCKYS